MKIVANTNSIKEKMFQKAILNSELANELNINESYLSSIITGSMHPSVKLARTIAKVLDCEITDLFKTVHNDKQPIIK